MIPFFIFLIFGLTYETKKKDIFNTLKLLFTFLFREFRVQVPKVETLLLYKR